MQKNDIRVFESFARHKNTRGTSWVPGLLINVLCDQVMFVRFIKGRVFHLSFWLWKRKKNGILFLTGSPSDGVWLLHGVWLFPHNSIHEQVLAILGNDFLCSKWTFVLFAKKVYICRCCRAKCGILGEHWEQASVFDEFLCKAQTTKCVLPQKLLLSNTVFPACTSVSNSSLLRMRYCNSIESVRPGSEVMCNHNEKGSRVSHDHVKVKKLLYVLGEKMLALSRSGIISNKPKPHSHTKHKRITAVVAQQILCSTGRTYNLSNSFFFRKQRERHTFAVAFIFTRPSLRSASTTLIWPIEVA